MTEEEWLRCDHPGMIVRECFAIPGANRKGRMLAVRCLELLREERGHDIDLAFLALAERIAWGERGERDRLRAFRTFSAEYQCLFNWSGYQAGLQTMNALGINQYRNRFLNESEVQAIVEFALDIFGNPFRPISFSPEWRTTTTVAIAQGMYESRDFGPMPLLADALQDAGCEVPEIIDHCRRPGPHVRGCRVVDGVLGKA
ncbi:MAG: hypothetical protein U0791_24570 [Gemmataceae bacterium]